jgi:hypothetical protein
MSAAHIDSDRMAESVSGLTAWSAGEAAHLAACADCRLELDMIAAARRLGVAQLTGFDPTRVAAGVHRRLAARPDEVRAPVVRHPWRWLAGLAAAAAVVLAVRSWSPTGSGSPQQAGQILPAVVSILPELDGLSAPQLEEVLRSIPPAAESLDHVDMAPLSALNAGDLERMLRSMEE